MGLLSKVFGGKKSFDSNIIESLIVSLQSGDEASRAKAAVELHRHPCDSSIAALSNALRDSSSKVRYNAAESLRCMAANRQCKIDPKPLIEALKADPMLANLKQCLRELGLQHQIDMITEQQFPKAAQYKIPCLPFLCPHCGFQISKVPSWPVHGNSEAFYAQKRPLPIRCIPYRLFLPCL